MKWGIENSKTTVNGTNTSSDDTPAPRGAVPNGEALAQLFGAPSDAEMMRRTMTALQDPEINLENKLIAFDNFEQIVEKIDNASNIQAIGLWPPLSAFLDDPEPEMRLMAAWCIGTAVQNNPTAQDHALTHGVIQKLVALVKREKGEHGVEAVRKKAAYAISSEIRNFQPGLNKTLEEMGVQRSLDAADMDAIDEFVATLRQA